MEELKTTASKRPAAICASTWEMGPPPPEAASCASSSVAEAPGHAPMNLNATNGASKRRSRRLYTKRCSSTGQPSGKVEPLALSPASVFLSLLDYRLEPDAQRSGGFYEQDEPTE